MKRDERTRQHAGTSTVSLWLDAYTDIFSDFDPRPFAERAVSDDFVMQVRKMAREVARVSVLRLLLPEGAEREEHERVIRKRLNDYFNHTYEQLDAETRAVRNKGLQMIAAGVAMMVVASYIYYRGPTLFSLNLLLVLLEPGGWFLFWNGLDNLFQFREGEAAGRRLLRQDGGGARRVRHLQALSDSRTSACRARRAVHDAEQAGLRGSPLRARHPAATPPPRIFAPARS